MKGIRADSGRNRVFHGRNRESKRLIPALLQAVGMVAAGTIRSETAEAGTADRAFARSANATGLIDLLLLGDAGLRLIGP